MYSIQSKTTGNWKYHKEACSRCVIAYATEDEANQAIQSSKSHFASDWKTEGRRFPSYRIVKSPDCITFVWKNRNNEKRFHHPDGRTAQYLNEL